MKIIPIISSIIMIIGCFMPWIQFGALFVNRGIDGEDGAIVLVTGIITCIVAIYNSLIEKPKHTWIYLIAGIFGLMVAIVDLNEVMSRVEKISEGLSIFGDNINIIGSGLYIIGLGSLGLILSGLLGFTKKSDKNKKQNYQHRESNKTNLKKCEYCAEWIQKEAKICRYCGKDVVTPIDITEEAIIVEEPEEELTKQATYSSSLEAQKEFDYYMKERAKRAEKARKENRNNLLILVSIVIIIILGTLTYIFKEDILKSSKADTAIESKTIVGKYPFTAIKYLNREDLQKYSKSELRIMRNEIFARHGFEFKKGGDLDTYFRQQSWYNAKANFNNDDLNNYEKENGELILSVEKGNNSKRSTTHTNKPQYTIITDDIDENDGYIVTANKANVREVPDSEAHIVFVADKNQYLYYLGQRTKNKHRINESSEYWYKIENSNGLVGWIYGSLIEKTDLSYEEHIGYGM